LAVEPVPRPIRRPDRTSFNAASAALRLRSSLMVSLEVSLSAGTATNGSSRPMPTPGPSAKGRSTHEARYFRHRLCQSERAPYNCPMNSRPPTMVQRPLIDGFGRQITYLRVSVTDRCDFRCTYCMGEDMVFLPKSEVLSFEEMQAVIGAFVERGA